ncbi:transposase family protein [Streptomyces sp. NPDC002758]
MRHTLAVVLAPTACAVLAGATSLAAVGEWIADAPAHVLQQLGVRTDPLLPLRSTPSESAVRRLLARIDGDALDRAVGSWLTDRRPKTEDPGGLRALAAGRACAEPPERRAVGPAPDGVERPLP